MKKFTPISTPNPTPSVLFDTYNRAGGVAFEIEDPSSKLASMTGSSFFSEPKFYKADQCVPRRSADGKMQRMIERMNVVDGNLQDLIPYGAFDDVAREVLSAAIAVARGNTPEDLLILANWLRNEMDIRLTPQVLLVLASRLGETKSMVRKYAPLVVQRPDDLKSCLLTHRYLFGSQPLSNGLAFGLSDALSKFGERAIMKYDGKDFPTWKDVVRWLPRKSGYPLPAPLAKYLVTGDVDPAVLPIVAARKELGRKTVFDDEAKALAVKSLVNWEVLLSQFGGNKKEVWTFLVENKLIGYMALLRNLRNILKAGVDRSVVSKVSDFISSKQNVMRARQFPFRFLSAVDSLVGIPSDEADPADVSELMAAVELAATVSCELTTRLSGMTAIFADISGSMEQPVSEKSKISCMNAASLMCAIAAKTSDLPYLFAFAEELTPVRYSMADTVIGISKKIQECDPGNCSTNAYKCIRWLTENGLAPDRIIIISDMQTYDSGNSFSDDQDSVQAAWSDYLKVDGTGKTWLHCVHINGYGDNPVQVKGRVSMVAGFSEKIFSVLDEIEKTGSVSVSMDGIRAKWKA